MKYTNVSRRLMERVTSRRLTAIKLTKSDDTQTRTLWDWEPELVEGSCESASTSSAPVLNLMAVSRRLVTRIIDSSISSLTRFTMIHCPIQNETTDSAFNRINSLFYRIAHSARSLSHIEKTKGESYESG